MVSYRNSLVEVSSFQDMMPRCINLHSELRDHENLESELLGMLGPLSKSSISGEDHKEQQQPISNLSDYD